jgi:hypothetical protein
VLESSSVCPVLGAYVGILFTEYDILFVSVRPVVPRVHPLLQIAAYIR